MRLGQLSRKLEVDSSVIVKVLKEHFREVNNHPNIKIQEEELAFLTSHFAPKSATPAGTEMPTETPQKTEKPETTEESVQKEDKEKVTEAKKPEYVESLRPKVITLENEFSEKTRSLESFKVEKPELEGLKVVGKIDLPEPKPKTKPEQETTKESSQATGKTNTIDEKGARQRYTDKKRRPKTRNNRNPVEARKKKAEYLERKKKEQEEKRLKELRKKHYEEKLKNKSSEKAPKKKKKKNVKSVPSQAQPQKPVEAKRTKNPIVRFWKWLNGHYDRFE